MTHIITGAAGSGKTAALYELLKKDVGNRILLVPDQFVFESERRVAEETDEKTSNIKVTGFTALCESILKKYCPRKTYADNTAKIAVMSGAVRCLCDDMKFYGNAARKNGFVEMCLSAVSELKSAGVTSKELFGVLYPQEDMPAEKLSSHLADKLSDIALLYRMYDEKLTEKYDDRQDNLTLAADMIARNDCFDENTTIYIDGFDSFTGAQRKFIKALADKGMNFTVALCTDESGAEVFAQCDRTQRLFENEYAFDCGKHTEIRRTRLSDKAPRYKSKALKALRDFLQTGKKIEGLLPCGEIVMGYSKNLSGEADFVCANIRKLVRESGYRYSDIAVICAAPAKYKDAVSSAALRYDVPLFVDLPVPISEKPLLRFFDALLKAADNPTGTNILRYIRSGFVRIPSEKKEGKTVPLTMREKHLIEQHLMEEYAECWDLKRKKWDKPMPHITNAQEQRVEDIRRATVTPLVEFAKSVKGAGGRELVKRFTAFLFDKADISAAIQGKCQDNSTRELRYVKELTEEYNQLWRTVSEMLSSLYETLDDTPMTISEFAALLRNCASNISISGTPNVLDSVLFGDPARTRSREVKAVFVMGASDGEFPDLYFENNGVFTADDIEQLAQNNLELEDDEARYSSAVLDAYKALTLAGERLFVTFTGEKENASEYVADISACFGIPLTSIDNLDTLYMIESVKSAEKQYVMNMSQLSDAQKRAVETAICKKGNGGIAIDRIKTVINNGGENAEIHRISDIAPIVFPQTALSPTAIEKLNGCKFAYFLRYGMNLSSSSGIAMNASNYGNIMHYIMKYCFERMYDGARENGNPDVPDSRIKELITDALADYREKYLLSEENMSARFNTLYNALSVTAFYLIKYMAKELEKSKFVPSYFELKLESGKSENGFDISPYSFDIELSNGSRQRVTIGGTVDRVDIAYNGNGGEIRVIDYKTGDKDAKINHIYYGLDLQLLLYLFTLAKNNEMNGYTASAALYHPSGKTSLKDVKAPSEELKRGIWLSEHKEKGFSVEGTQQESERSLYDGIKFEHDKQTKTNFYSAVTISKDRLSQLEGRIERVVRENTEQVKSGIVDAKPLADGGERISCKYCEFRDICGTREGSAVDVNSAEAADFAENIVISRKK